MSREHLAAQQADLLRALLADGTPPPGFDTDRVAVEVRALRAKRRRVVAYLRPDLAQELDDRFTPLFDEYAAAHPREEGVRMRQDAENFANWLTAKGELKPPRWWRRLPGRAIRAR
ncbi:hypothetical protein [Amycolatopsis albispora]|uniref:SCO6045-like C-terminal domain-containing protein n=1 Tax=Amycolatopsis albispora TaxID=1804986 RepID=A0A344L612_9PSEU|nr:hypothetical protein [Amycolatopsis albispora]AXB43486.1 hypothetical protein A4R43_13805 [Amycolatopsis albispora]